MMSLNMDKEFQSTHSGKNKSTRLERLHFYKREILLHRQR